MVKHRKGMRSGIYKITCLGNGRYYYGRTLDITKRINDHLKCLRKGNHTNPHLQNCFNKYGEGSLAFELIDACPDGDSLVALEQVYIDKHLGLPDCMNCNPSAIGCAAEWTKERRAARSAWAKATQAHKAMNTTAARAKTGQALRGRKRPADVIECVAAAQRGRTKTESHKAALREAWDKKRKQGKADRAYRWKAVTQLDATTGELVATYPTSKAAAHALGCSVTPIAKAARGERPLGVGYKWRYES